MLRFDCAVENLQKTKLARMKIVFIILGIRLKSKSIKIQGKYWFPLLKKRAVGSSLNYTSQ